MLLYFFTSMVFSTKGIHAFTNRLPGDTCGLGTDSTATVAIWYFAEFANATDLDYIRVKTLAALSC
jgi:hypothetical protein